MVQVQTLADSDQTASEVRHDWNLPDFGAEIEYDCKVDRVTLKIKDQEFC